MSSILRTKKSITPKVVPITVARSDCFFAVERLLLEDVIVLDGVEESEVVVGVRDTILLSDVVEKLDTDGSRPVSIL